MRHFSFVTLLLFTCRGCRPENHPPVKEVKLLILCKANQCPEGNRDLLKTAQAQGSLPGSWWMFSPSKHTREKNKWIVTIPVGKMEYWTEIKEQSLSRLAKWVKQSLWLCEELVSVRKLGPHSTPIAFWCWVTTRGSQVAVERTDHKSFALGRLKNSHRPTLALLFLLLPWE